VPAFCPFQLCVVTLVSLLQLPSCKSSDFHRNLVRMIFRLFGQWSLLNVSLFLDLIFFFPLDNFFHTVALKLCCVGRVVSPSARVVLFPPPRPPGFFPFLSSRILGQEFKFDVGFADRGSSCLFFPGLFPYWYGPVACRDGVLRRPLIFTFSFRKPPVLMLFPFSSNFFVSDLGFLFCLKRHAPKRPSHS